MHVLGAQPAVFEVQLVQVHLGDLYQRNDRIPLGHFQGPDPPEYLKGAMT